MGLFSSGSSKTKTTTTPYKGTQPAIDAVTGQLLPAFLQSQQAISQGSPEDFIANLDPTQLAAIGKLTGGQFFQPSIDAATGMIGQGQQLAGSGGNVLQGIASGDIATGIDQSIFDQVYNPQLVQDRIDAAGADIRRNLSEGELLDIDRTFAGIGGAGSSRAGIAEGVAIRGAQDRLGDISTQIRNDAFNQAVQRSMDVSRQNVANQLGAGSNLLQQGLGSTQFGIGSAADLGLTQARSALDAGSLLQQQQQAEIQGVLEKQAYDASLPFLGINQFNQAGLPIASGFGTTVSKSKQDQGILGQLAPFAQLAGGLMMSDRRLKKNIQYQGKIYNLPYYTWDWTEEAKDFVQGYRTHGWIAQEVAEVYPEAVSVHESGYLQIDERTLAQQAKKAGNV